MIIITTLVALGLRVYYQYTRPGFLLGVTEYDDGPYFGSAVRLVHGSLPYKDFILVQPPGITLLMSPVGLLTYWTGTAWGLAIGRILTVLAGTAGVALAGLLVRHRGPLAALLTCGFMAVYSDGVAAAHTVLVEPWLVLFCLAGAVAVFDGDRITASTRRLLGGGVLLGFAGAVEAWAIVPVLVLAALCLPQLKRTGIFIGGVAAGFVIPVLLPAIAGPSVQLYRSLGHRPGGVPGARRAGGSAVPPAEHDRPAVRAGLAEEHPAAGRARARGVRGRHPGRRHRGHPAAPAHPGLVRDRDRPCRSWSMFLWPPQFHYHFAEFLARFMALTIALPVSRLLRRRPAGRPGFVDLAAHGRARRPPARPWYSGHRQP